MNSFLRVVRLVSLGGVIVLVLALVLKKGIPSGNIGIFLIAAPVVYLLFSFFTWLSAKSTTHKLSMQYGTDIPAKSFIATFFRGLFIDLFSPVLVIKDLFGNLKNRFFMLIVTYLIIGVYVFVWFRFIN